MFVLTVDIGNSHTVFGIHDGERKPLASYRIQTDRNSCPDELYVLIERLLARAGYSFSLIKTVVIGSVVPELEHSWRKIFLDTSVKFIIANEKANWSFRIDLPNPSQLGSDRLANAEGALAYGAPFIVVDAGTATTFDVVGKEKDHFVYYGGVIAPGVGISLQALTSKTSRLSSVSLSRSARGDFPVIGRDTASAIRSGVIRGFVAMVDGLVDAIIEEKKFPTTIPVIATGGFSGYLRGISNRVKYYSPDVTLEGLYAIASK